MPVLGVSCLDYDPCGCVVCVVQRAINTKTPEAIHHVQTVLF